MVEWAKALNETKLSHSHYVCAVEFAPQFSYYIRHYDFD